MSPERSEKMERKWRCPLDGSTYTKSDQCNNRCFLTPGLQEQHYPVTKTTVITFTEGHQ